jgi:two-component system, NarL family, response regulator NreC
MKTRIMLADDHRIMREGLKSLLNEEADMEVIGDADNGRRAIEMVDELRPDVVVMDIGMPELNGIEATRRIVRWSRCRCTATGGSWQRS